MLFVFSIKVFKSCTATVTVLGEGLFCVRLLRKEETPFGVLGVEVMLDVGVVVLERSKGLLLHDCATGGDNPLFVILLLRRMLLPLSDIGHIHLYYDKLHLQTQKHNTYHYNLSQEPINKSVSLSMVSPPPAGSHVYI